MNNNTLNDATILVGRILLATIFLIAGLNKLGAGYEGTAQYMSSMGIPGALLPLVIATEVLGAIALIVGFQTRIAAFLLAGFTFLAAVFFHWDFADRMQSILFMKNLAITGGLLVLVTTGAGQFSVDRLFVKRKGGIA